MTIEGILWGVQKVSIHIFKRVWEAQEGRAGLEDSPLGMTADATCDVAEWSRWAFSREKELVVGFLVQSCCVSRRERRRRATLKA